MSHSPLFFVCTSSEGKANTLHVVEYTALIWTSGYLSIKNSTSGKVFKAGKFDLIMYGDMLLDVGVSKKEV